MCSLHANCFLFQQINVKAHTHMYWFLCLVKFLFQQSFTTTVNWRNARILWSNHVNMLTNLKQSKWNTRSPRIFKDIFFKWGLDRYLFNLLQFISRKHGLEFINSHLCILYIFYSSLAPEQEGSASVSIPFNWTQNQSVVCEWILCIQFFS